MAEKTIDREMELTEHLEELRSRIIRILIYLAIGTVVGWFIYDPVYRALTKPVEPYFKEHGSLIFTSFTEGFFLKLKVAALAGTTIALPFITWELWRFVSPGLTCKERRTTLFLLPFSTLLFAGGIALAYWVLPAGVRWFLSYLPNGVQLMQKLSDYMLFLFKMCLAFGIVFQLPLVLMLLGKVGIVTSAGLRSKWRHAVVILALVAAIATPSNDPFSMLVMTLPLVILYMASILLVRWVE